MKYKSTKIDKNLQKITKIDGYRQKQTLSTLKSTLKLTKLNSKKNKIQN